MRARVDVRRVWSSSASHVVAVVLCCLAANFTSAGDEPRWGEYFKVFAAVRNETEESIIAAADAALAPLGFSRESTGTASPGNLMPGIFASYETKGSARALIAQGSSPECLVFSAKNYDPGKKGLVERAGAAIEARFRTAFGPDVSFFSDAKCTLPL